MKKGISLISLMATITIMIILISTVAISGTQMSNQRKLADFATEISALQDSVNNYLKINPYDYPILDSVIVDLNQVSKENQEQFIANGDRILNNTIHLYEIDYQKINHTHLKYGKDGEDKADRYLLSAETGKVYYIKGLKVGKQVYYTLTEELKKKISYQTSDTQTLNGKELISYEQEDESEQLKKVKVKIPLSYSDPIVKIGDNTYTATLVENQRIYEIECIPGTVIDIIYRENDTTKTTSYKVLENKSN